MSTRNITPEDLKMPLLPEPCLSKLYPDRNREARMFTATIAGATEWEYLSLLSSLVGIFKPTKILETGTLSGDGTMALISGAEPGAFVVTVNDEGFSPELVYRVERYAGPRQVGVGFHQVSTRFLTTLTDWHRFIGMGFTFAFLDSSIPDRAEEFRWLSDPATSLMDLSRPCCVCVHDMSRWRHHEDADSEVLPDVVSSLRTTARDLGWSLLHLHQSRGMIVLVWDPEG